MWVIYYELSSANKKDPSTLVIEVIESHIRKTVKDLYFCGEIAIASICISIIDKIGLMGHMDENVAEFLKFCSSFMKENPFPSSDMVDLFSKIFEKIGRRGD